MRYEIQDCSKYQSCRIFIENTATVDITMSDVKSQAAVFKSKIGVKQQDIPQKTIIGFETEKHISKWRHNRRIFYLNYRTDFTLKNDKLLVEIGEKKHAERDSGYKKKNKKKRPREDWLLLLYYN